MSYLLLRRRHRTPDTPKELSRDEIFLRVLQRRRLERTQENINRVASTIHCKPSIPLPFSVRHWLFWERPGCYPCRKMFKNLEEYNEHYIDNHLGEDES